MKLLWITLAMLTATGVKAQPPTQPPAQTPTKTTGQAAGQPPAKTPAPSPDTSMKAKIREVFSNVLTSYNNPTHYSATIITKLSEGKQYQTMIVHVTMKNDTKNDKNRGFTSSALIERILDIATNKLTQRSTDRTVDDGTNVIQIYPATREYAMIPRKPSRISDLFMEPLNTCLRFGVPITAAERKVDGRMYYDVLGNGAKGKWEILIDEDDIRVRSIHMEIVHGASTRFIDITVKDELFGKDVFQARYDTTAPSNYKKVDAKEDPDPWDD